MLDERRTEAATPVLRQAGRPAYLPLIGALSVATFLQWIGSSAVLPLLPIYLQRKGSSDAMVGAVMASFFAAGVIAQYLSGRLGDRIGHRAVLLLGLLGYAVASLGFLLELGGAGYVVLRAAQGAAAGAAQVAMLALVTRAVPLAVRGRAVSAVYGAELAGIAIGPLVGSALGVSRMGLLFVVASVAALLAGIPVLVSRLVSTPAVAAGAAPAGRPVGGRGLSALLGRLGIPVAGPAGRVLAGVVVSAVTGGLLTGVYEACWTLLLDRRGATAWQIGLSWTLFAVPFVIVSPVAGWVADHRDRRRVVVAALLTSVGFALLYPWVGDIAWLVGLGVVESAGVAFAYPAAQSLLGQAAPAEAIGRAQGLVASAQTAAIAVAAGVSGGLFALGPWVPFTVVSVLALALTATLPLVWRGIPGRVGHS